jgi:hypothetical protein
MYHVCVTCCILSNDNYDSVFRFSIKFSYNTCFAQHCEQNTLKCKRDEILEDALVSFISFKNDTMKTENIYFNKTFYAVCTSFSYVLSCFLQFYKYLLIVRKLK